MSHSSGPKHTSAAKAPIIFDDHTDLSKIELQYFIDTRVGKQTCQARCEFCWLDRDNVRGFHQDVDEAARVITRLREQGFKVVPIVSDSFAERGKYLRSGLLNNNNDWYMGNAAWSSGRPLLGDDHEALLDLCVDNGIHTIIMTSHGTEDRERAFKGLTQPSVVREAVRRIQAYSARAGWEFHIILTFTLSARNNSREHITRYFDHCAQLGVQVARFNQFADIRGTHQDMRMGPQQVAETYRALREVYEAHPSAVELSVSEDFGFWGVEVMGFPPQVGHCVAGEHLFGVVYPNIYVCPVNLTLVAGTITPEGEVRWNEAIRERLTRAKRHPEFGGCIGVAYPHSEAIRDMFREPPQALVQLRAHAARATAETARRSA